MGSVIGDILPLAIAIALSPFPIIGLILILFTKNARTNSLFFLFGWLIGLAAVAAIVILLVNSGRLSLGADDDKNGHRYKVQLDGYDQSEFLRSVKGTAVRNNGVKSARDHFFYTDDDALLVGLRIGDYKISYAEQRMEGTMGVWGEPFTKLRMSKMYNLMQDPFERADITSNTYWDWIMDHVPQVYQGMEGVFGFLESFKAFPPRTTPPSFNPANMLETTLREIKAKDKIEKAFPILLQTDMDGEKAPAKKSKARAAAR